jgi:NAD(P)-dependent dehydrogenase (short-subunit alcohol dehydrogenase family)
MTELTRKTAFVTGGGSGIGRALAIALAAEGARVVVADILKVNAEKVVAEIVANGGSALAVFCDVCERESVSQAKNLANETFGHVSLLFANAGATSFARLTDVGDNEIDWMTAVNFSGVSHCLKTFLPDMIVTRDGHVAATASMAGLIPSLVPFHVPYTSAKAGVIGMMLNLRDEIAQFGVGCTVFCPDAVTTQIIDTPRYRPARFGGPSDGKVTVPEGVVLTAAPDFRPPEEAAQQLLFGIRKNRAMVVTNSSRRRVFTENYLQTVLTAFDDAAEFEAQRDAI